MNTTSAPITVESLRAAHQPTLPMPTTAREPEWFDRLSAQRNVAAPAVRRPTAAQRDLLKALFAERAGHPEAERIRAEINAIMAAGGLTFEVVSATITDLKAIPRAKAAPASGGGVKGGTWESVPDGRYAVPSATGNNDLDFFMVETETEDGDWKGFRRVYRVIGGNVEAQVKGPVRRAALEAIRDAVYERPVMTFEGEEYGGNGTFTGPEGAAMRYSDEIGQCHRCNRSLTRIESRQAGIGPVCAGKE